MWFFDGSFCGAGEKACYKSNFPRVFTFHERFKTKMFRYRPTISVKIVAKLLSMSEDELTDWLVDLNLEISEDGTLDCRILSSKAF